MKKFASVTISCLVVLALTGCPQAGQPQITANTADESALPAGFGGIEVEGSFNSDTKSLDWNDIVDFESQRIKFLTFDFYLQDGDKGFSDDSVYYYYEIQVVDGDYSDIIVINEGDYDVFVTAYDLNGGSVFGWFNSVTVVAGETTTMDVILALKDYYFFNFVVDDLPGGDYDDYGYATLSVGGNYYYCSYSRWYTNWELGEYVVLFTATLPIDFDGDDAMLIITDQGGNPIATELQFNILDLNNPLDGDWFIHTPYLLPEDIGYLDVNISFQRY